MVEKVENGEIEKEIGNGRSKEVKRRRNKDRACIDRIGVIDERLDSRKPVYKHS